MQERPGPARPGTTRLDLVRPNPARTCPVRPVRLILAQLGPARPGPEQHTHTHTYTHTTHTEHTPGEVTFPQVPASGSVAFQVGLLDI